MERESRQRTGQKSIGDERDLGSGRVETGTTTLTGGERGLVSRGLQDNSQ